MNRKKIFIILWLCIFFLPFVVNAETCKKNEVSIKSIEVLNISENVVEKNIPVINDMSITLDLEMSEVDDSIEYEMIIRNDSNSDYTLDSNAFNIQSDYVDYKLETKDKTNIVKAKSSSTAVLTIQYKNKVPEELLSEGPYTDNKTIDVLLSDKKNIINPKTRQSLFNMIGFLLFIIISLMMIFKKKKKMGILLSVLLSILLPFGAFALCNWNIKIISNVEIHSGNDSIVYIDYIYILRKSGTLSIYNNDNLSTTEYREATFENLNEEVIAQDIKWISNNYCITKNNDLYYIDSNSLIFLASDITQMIDYSKFLDSNNTFYYFDASNLILSAENVSYYGNIPTSVFGRPNQYYDYFYKSNGTLFYYSYLLKESIDLSEIIEKNDSVYKTRNGNIHSWYKNSNIIENSRVIGTKKLLFLDTNNRLSMLKQTGDLYDTGIVVSYINDFDGSTVLVIDENNNAYLSYYYSGYATVSQGYGDFKNVSETILEIGSYKEYERNQSGEATLTSSGYYYRTSSGLYSIWGNKLISTSFRSYSTTPFNMESTNIMNQNVSMDSFNYEELLSYANDELSVTLISDYRKNKSIMNQSSLTIYNENGMQYVIKPEENSGIIK